MDPFEGDRRSAPIEYEPVSVKDVLVEMKDTAELLIDLSYSAVLHGNDALAEEVLRLEHRMDVLEMRARMSLLMAARKPKDAEQLAPVLGIVAATDTISDAAGDIAETVLDEVKLPEAIRTALPEAVETLVRAEVNSDSPYASRTLQDIDLESVTGIRAIAIRRGDEWLLNPGPDTRIETGDVVFLRGPDAGMYEAVEDLTGDPYEEPPVSGPEIDDLERAVDTIVTMKNLSELSVDLAYSSVLFDSDELAEEVGNLEVEVDALQARLDAWTLRAAAEADDPVQLRGLIRIGNATESISDAATEISEGVLRAIDVHPVVQLAVRESDEILTRLEVTAGSDLDGITVTEGVPDVTAMMTVLAIRRPGEGWLLVADRTATIEGGDILITKGTRTAAADFEALSG